MSLLERLAELGRVLLTTEAELRQLRETLSDVRQEVRHLTEHMHDLRERLVRLETARAADRAQMEASIAQFKAEVERAEVRLTRLALPREEPPALPDR